MTRKDFLRSLVGVGVGVAGVSVIAGCGDDGGGPIDAPAAVCTAPTAAIGSNHGHVITVSIADVNAGANKTYAIAGTAGHMHDVTVSAAQFTQIKSGMTVTVQSTDGGSGHTHSVTVQCIS